MKLERLEVKNFMSFEHAELDLDQRGLVLVTGRNLDAAAASSNGSGKSALFADAIPWCLYGETLRGRVYGASTREFKSSDVVNRAVGADCSVLVRFSNGGHTYEVTRYRDDRERRNKVYLSTLIPGDQGAEDLTAPTDAETDQRIIQILGLNYSAYCHAVVFGQGPIRRFSQATDSERRRALEDFFDTELWSEARKLVMVDHQAAAKAHLKATTDLAVTERLLDEQAAAVIKAEAEVNQIPTTEGDMVCRVCLTICHRTDLYTIPETPCGVCRHASGKHVAAVPHGAETIEAAVIKREQEWADMSVAADKIEKLVERANRLTLPREAWVRLMKEIETAMDQVARLAMDRTYIDRAIEEAGSRTKFAPGDECPECLRPMSAADVAKYKKLINKRIKELEAKVDRNEKTRKEASQRRISLEKTRDDDDQKRKAANEMTGKLNVLRAEIKTAEGKVQLAINCRTAYQNRQKQQEKETAEAQRRLQHAQAGVRNMEQEVEKNRKALATADKSKKALDFWADGFGSHGIKDFGFRRALGALNARLGVQSERLTGGDFTVQLVVDDLERIRVEVRTKNGLASVPTMSGGEARRIDLALALGFAYLVETSVWPIQCDRVRRVRRRPGQSRFRNADRGTVPGVSAGLVLRDNAQP